MAIIAFQDCVNDFEPEAPIGLHISIHADSDHDAGCMRWQESQRQPSSSAIIELPTGEEVLSASQLSLQSSHRLQSQPLHQQPREQCVSNQTGGTPATGGVSPTNENQLQTLSASPHSVNQPSKQVTSQAPTTANHVEVLQTSPISSISPTSNVEEVGEVDRAAGVSNDLPNLAKQALLLQPQLLNPSLQTTQKETRDTPCLEDAACGKLTLAAEKLTAIVPDSQPVAEAVDTMAGFGPFKSPQETEKATGESGSANNSRLKRPTHKLCGSSSKKADLDWDEGLRVEPDISLPHPEASATAKNAKEAPQDIEKTGTKGRKKPNPRAKQKIKPLELTSQTGNALKENKRNSQVTKTLTSARPPRNAAEVANKKMALAAERETAVYDPDDPIESSYPGSTSLEDLAEHIQIDDQSIPQAGPPPPKRDSIATAKPLTNDSSDLSGVALHCGKDAVVETPCVAPEPLGKQVTQAQKTKATGLDTRNDSVIDLCSDSSQDEDTGQTRQSNTKATSGVDLPTKAADCVSEAAALRNKPQSIAKKHATTRACIGPAPVKERRTTKLSENKEGAGTTLNLVSQRKRETGNPSQVSKNVCEFMSRNQLSAQKPIMASNARKSGLEKSKNQGKPTSKYDEVNSSTLPLQKGNRTADVVQTRIPPMTITRHEQQKPTRSVKFDLGVNHTPTSSTGPSDNANAIDGKAVLPSTTRKDGGSSLSRLTNYDAPMASENTEDEDEEQTSSSLDEFPKYTSVRPKQIGWQSRTVDENGSPIPRLQHARKNYSQRVLGVLDETDKPKVPPHADMPPAISEHSQLQRMTTFNPSAYSNSKTSTNRDIAGRHSFQSSNMFAPGERHGHRYRYMKANDLCDDQKEPCGKFGGRNKPATSSYKKSFDSMQRLKAHQTNSIPRTMGKRHHMIDVRDSKPFKVIEHNEDAVNTGAETDDECSPPRYPPESSEYVESQGHEWEKQLRDNYKGGRDILSDTSKVSTKATPTYSLFIPRMLMILLNANRLFQ